MDRPWLPLTPDSIDTLPAQLGVYEVGNASGEVVKIGYAGGRTRFGMRSALLDELGAGTGVVFRHEFTHGYLTRYEELLMVHAAVHGAVPSGTGDGRPIGRLHIDRRAPNRGD